MRLIHLTDPHLTTPPAWRELPGRTHHGKRFLGYASWARKRRHSLRRSWLDELTTEIRRLEPDGLLLTGDLTQIGTEEEIIEARDWLESLATITRIHLVPGNHDTYGHDSWPVLRREWADFLPKQGADAFPVVHREGDVTVLGLSSAIPTLPLAATGELGVGQLTRLEAALEAHGATLRFLLLHHPPLPGMISYRKRLKDARQLSELLARQPVDVILHGHRHRNQASVRQGIRIYCTAPASAALASFRVFDISGPESAGWQVKMSLRQRSPATPGNPFDIVERQEWLVSARD